jgi:hypothetical protein
MQGWRKRGGGHYFGRSENGNGIAGALILRPFAMPVM